MKIAEGDEKQKYPSDQSTSSKQPTDKNQEELKGLKEKVDHMVKEVKKMMERVQGHDPDG